MRMIMFTSTHGHVIDLCKPAAIACSLKQATGPLFVQAYLH